MKWVRRAHATQYIEKKTEAQLIGSKLPLNPLQHTTDTTTVVFYAKKGADDRHAALNRLMRNKEYSNPAKTKKKYPDLYKLAIDLKLWRE